ncbi:MAG: copper resistance CopC family protein [Chloroflexota bacterium]
MARSLTRAASVAALSLLLLLHAPPAFAHAAFVSGTPGPGDEVAGSPAELVIQFTQNLDPSRTSLEVRDASGATVAKGGELGDGPREFRLALPELAPGEYTVRWTSFSAEDGELARDSYGFTVVAAASPSPFPSPSPQASPSSRPSPSATPAPASPTPTTPTPSSSPAAGGGATASSDGLVIVPILAAALVVAGLAVWLFRRRAT